MKRNLYYFLCPLTPEIWRWNVERLRSYWAAFNGRKLVVVAVGPGTESETAVQSAFEGSDAELIVAKNDPDLGETPSFLDGLGRLESLDPEECTFYAHAKGQTRVDKGDSVRRWTEAMYFMSLSNTSLIDHLIRKYATLGCFKQVMINWRGVPWAFAGTFFWIRHDALFSRNWRSINNDRYGVEAYPGRVFREEEAFALTPCLHPDVLYDHAPERERFAEWMATLSREVAMLPGLTESQRPSATG